MNIRDKLKFPEHCPSCYSSSVAYILYGLPDFSELGSDYTNKHIVLGGCIISGDNPLWHCNDCEFEWNDRLTEQERMLAIGERELSLYFESYEDAVASISKNPNKVVVRGLNNQGYIVADIVFSKDTATLDVLSDYAMDWDPYSLIEVVLIKEKWQDSQLTQHYAKIYIYDDNHDLFVEFACDEKGFLVSTVAVFNSIIAMPTLDLSVDSDHICSYVEGADSRLELIMAVDRVKDFLVSAGYRLLIDKRSNP